VLGQWRILRVPVGMIIIFMMIIIIPFESQKKNNLKVREGSDKKIIKSASFYYENQ